MLRILPRPADMNGEPSARVSPEWTRVRRRLRRAALRGDHRGMALHVNTVLEPVGPATAIELSDAQVAELGGGRRAPVRITVGDRTARLRLAVMGGKNLIGLSKAARADLGVEIGDSITASIELDPGERVVEVPPDLAAALDADPHLRAAFEALSYSHRKEHVRAITEAKRPETRARRIAAALDMLRG